MEVLVGEEMFLKGGFCWYRYQCFFFQAEDGIRDFCLSRGLEHSTQDL